MKKSTEKNILKITLILSILGIVISLYLLENHYAVTSSFCDIGEAASCSLVNASIYSEVFNVPVALLGAFWFVLLTLMAWKALAGRKEILVMMLGWNVLGLLFVIYLIRGEFLLRAICPLCTVIHIIILITLALSAILYWSQQKKPSLKSTFKAARPWIIGIIILNLLPLVYFNLPTEKKNYDALAQCLASKEVHMYGSFRCAVCAKTRAMFGDSFQYIQEIECHPQGKNSQWQLCQEKGIVGTPTWIMEPNNQEIKRHTGFLSMEELREFSECTE